MEKELSQRAKDTAREKEKCHEVTKDEIVL